MRNNVLIIAPHPDDEVLGCGAQIKNHSLKGDRVFVLVVTRGTPKYYSDQLIENVRNEARLAHKILGVEETLFLDFHAPLLDTYPLSEITGAIKKYIDTYSINTVYLPHRGDIHNDHRVVFNATLVACRPVGDYTVNKMLAYETMSETEWAAPFSDDFFVPTVFSDVSDTFQFKIEAMRCFSSQLKEFPNPRSLENLEALAKYRGATVGLHKAEAFMHIRTII
jgi:LmbE family N-acetylglucosaminyl deacetylase